MYDQYSRTRYNFKVIDTVVIFDSYKNKYTLITKMKIFFQNDSPGGFKLELFVRRKGRFVTVAPPPPPQTLLLRESAGEASISQVGL